MLCVLVPLRDFLPVAEAIACRESRRLVKNGSRTFLVEVQALVSVSRYGTPQRVVQGVDSKRVALLAAILEKEGFPNVQRFNPDLGNRRRRFTPADANLHTLEVLGCMDRMRGSWLAGSTFCVRHRAGEDQGTSNRW